MAEAVTKARAESGDKDAAPFTVRIEALAWVNTLLGGTGSGTMDYDESVEPGETLREVLRRFSGRYPRLKDALWVAGTGNLGEHIEIAVNEAILDIHHTLDSPLAPGDRITLMGQFIGG